MVLPVVTYIYMYKKYAFQEDAYRPLVGRIPWYSGREVSALGEGVVFAWGGGCLLRGCVYLGGVSAQRGVCPGGISKHAMGQTPLVNRITDITLM